MAPGLLANLPPPKQARKKQSGALTVSEIDNKRQKTEEVQAVVCLSQDLLPPGVKCSLGKLSSPPVI